jgi:hypothetical protein
MIEPAVGGDFAKAVAVLGDSGSVPALVVDPCLDRCGIVDIEVGMG